ncbi:MAG: hypothetical protein JJU15_09450 [Pararhodobacter sp.]|nr:hypothetical protein [Pararhodobacter sp.]
MTEPMTAKARSKQLSRVTKDVKPDAFVPMPDGMRRVPVVKVPASLPVYRFDNGRLIAELHEHAHQSGDDLDTLRETSDSAGTQALLHRLLMTHAADERGPIQQELRRLRQQTEPLLITAEGMVVNGNRRLAAMRGLLAEDPQHFACYSEVLVAVLPPDCSAADIDYIEAALQMVPETKLRYGWVNRRLKLRRQLETLKLPRDWVLSAYQISEPEQLERELAELTLAEAFLSERQGEPGHYAAIADAEPLFVALNEQLPPVPPRLRPVWQSIGFAMIAARATLGSALGGVFPFEQPAPKHLPSLALRRFAQEKLHVDDAPLDGETPASAALLEDLRSFFDGCSEEDDGALRDLIEVMRILREEQREAEKPAVMLQRMRRTRQQMDRLSPERLTQEQRNALRSEVAAIQAQANYLLGEAAEHRFEQRKTTMVKAMSRYMKRWRDSSGRS